MTKRMSKSQKGGISITKRGAVLEDIKKDRLEKYEQHLQALESTSFDDHKAMWLSIELSRPKHFEILGKMGGVHIEGVRKNKKGKDETVLQYALRVADFDTIKSVLTYDNQKGFNIDQINVYDLLLAIDHSESLKVLELMFNILGPPIFNTKTNTTIRKRKYTFYDPHCKALLASLNKNQEVAKLVMTKVKYDHISLNKNITEIVNIIQQKNDDNYNKLFRELVIGSTGRPKLDLNQIIYIGTPKTIIFNLLNNYNLLEIALVDGRANPNVREDGSGNTPLHIVVELYKSNQGAAKPILKLLKTAGTIPMPNLKTGKSPLDLLDQSQRESFINDDKQNFK